MKRFILKAMGASAAIILAGSAVVHADALYQDSQALTGYIIPFTNNQEIGEQIWLGTGSTPEYLTNFSFEIYTPESTFEGSVQADVRLYENNNTPFNGYNTPGPLFYDSGLFSVQPPISTGPYTSGLLIFELSDLQSGTLPLDPNYVLPANFTFTITFSGLGVDDTIYMPTFDPPQVGANAGDFWYNVSDTWELVTNNVGPLAFGAEFYGSPSPTPEPTVLCLGALGVAALAVIARRRQRG